MMILDTSVILKWLDPQEEFADKASGLLRAHLFGLQKMAAPFVMYAEVLVALRKWGWPSSAIEEGLGLIFAANLETIPPSLELLAKAGEIAEQAKRPRRETYDSIFLASAIIGGAPFVTADEELLKYASAIPELKTYHLKNIDRESNR